MSQIASFYLLKDGRRQELSNGDCSGAVYMAIRSEEHTSELQSR